MSSYRQIISSKADDSSETTETITPVIFDDKALKRREILARRPSYRKILNDLSSTEAAGAVTAIPAEIKQEEEGDRGDETATVTLTGGQFLKVLPASAIQLSSQDGTLQGIQTLTMTNAGPGTTGAIVQYATQGQDGQFYVPGKSIWSPWNTASHILFSRLKLLSLQLTCRLIKYERHKLVLHRE